MGNSDVHAFRAQLVWEVGISQSDDQRHGTADESWKRPEGPLPFLLYRGVRV